ncbi:AAA family ATPase [Paraliomyxa miuraensis]|uniref:AAA family ATPase n=1 Tax=Paraliomyxa miuraensis TaxID=376150 RepID=UPI0022545657|nr:MoxR family ATPase [Paraliomyxa miuraensis]MCX4240131.1 MoxR family ATPase [Paraliomyxa miuraensis]
MANTRMQDQYIDVATWQTRNERLDAIAGMPGTAHQHDRPSLNAINAALAAGRPLLVRGEPGTGKSQLARAAAQRLGRQYAWRVMDAQTKVSDLFYDFDAVGRLARAQIAGALCQSGAMKPERVEALLDERQFVRPGPLWWAFDAAGARQWLTDAKAVERGAASEPPSTVDDRPYVVLIDEIDKTDPSVPNGLLEALGQGTFSVLGDKAVVTLHHADGPSPLIIITSNDERELPGAFVRRCLVHYISVPKDEQGLAEWLVARGRTHFPELEQTVLTTAAAFVHSDRTIARELGLVAPGQAEYLDLLRAVQELATDADAQLGLLREIKDLALKKHPDQRDRETSKVP